MQKEYNAAFRPVLKFAEENMFKSVFVRYIFPLNDLVYVIGSNMFFAVLFDIFLHRQLSSSRSSSFL